MTVMSNKSRVSFTSALALLGVLILTSSTLHARPLPVFSPIVERNSAAVVSISVTSKMKAEQTNLPQELIPQLPEDSPFNEFFKRFLDKNPDSLKERKTRGFGSGFLISHDGYILTNAHVVKDAENISVQLSDRSEQRAQLVGLDMRTDVALIKIEARELSTVMVGDSDDLKVGEWVLAIGSPFGLERTATQGIVSALGRSLPSETYVPFIQTDVAVNPGNSGGPLFNLRGEAVGINSQIFSRTGGYMGLSFAIPINLGMQIAKQLKKQGYVSRGWLGVTIQPLTRALAESFKLNRSTGALVAQVTPNSPAAKAGVQVGDIIMSYDGAKVTESAALPPLVGATPIGETVPIRILRNGKMKTLKVKIQALKDNDKIA